MIFRKADEHLVSKVLPRFVKYNEVRKKAHWANVQRCGSIWTCPVCAKQITEKTS